MEFMLDTLNLEEIKKWAAILPLAGVTSNPSIAKKEGEIDFFEQMKKVRAIVGEEPSLHAQVVAEDVEGIIKDAHKLRDTLGGNLYIKIPVSPEGLTAIKQLKKEGFQITATAIYTVFQGLLAIEAGADYLAPYYNRMENLNTDPVEVISQLALAIERKQATTKILAASFKNVSQMTKALAAGAQAVTAGADIFAAGFANPSIQKAVDDFTADWESTQGRSTI
ncbi:fructose-6-phosphate aldolase [Streptococcus tangpeifui]|uniref:fructose-6-phosphate aldolase n=1 Tax=Streptococcus tangpeifui TaxID=2709400 RepID=UPI0013EAF035|nr:MULTISPECIES: fructose-6-phosphate aldolase [unclassified Streptococcus]